MHQGFFETEDSAPVPAGNYAFGRRFRDGSFRLELRVSSFLFRVYGLRVWGSGFRVPG